MLEKNIKNFDFESDHLLYVPTNIKGAGQRMKVHHKVNHLERKVPPNTINNELLTVDNFDARSFIGRYRFVHLSIIFCAFTSMIVV
jgi:hypothetical protein